MELDASEPKEQSTSLENFPLRFIVPTGISGRNAHHLVIQATDLEVTLSFFELKPPIAFGPPEEVKEALKQGINAECVARVIVAKGRFNEFLKTLNEFPLNEK